MKTETASKMKEFSVEKNKNVPQSTLLQKLKDHFYFQFMRLKKEGNIPELIFWLASNAMMIYTVRFAVKDGFAPSILLATVLNMLATFAVPVFAMIFPRNSFLGRLSFRTQTYFDMLVICGSFLCYGFNMYKYISNFDKVQHFLSGFLVVFLGAELLKTFFKKKKVEPVFGLIGGVGLSFAIIVIWELFEFTADFLIEGSTNQGYTNSPSFDLLFFKIFGMGAGNEGQYPLFDTVFDMMYATVGIAVAAVLYIVVMKIKEKKCAKESV